MKPATRHKQTIAGIEVETFPTTRKSKYVRGHRCWHQSYWRLVMPGETRQAKDEFYNKSKWIETIEEGTTLRLGHDFIYRRRVGRKP